MIPRLLLADLLREDLGLTGTHLGCEHGVCGACTVLVDGEPARSCLIFAVQAGRREVDTIEGLAGDGPGRCTRCRRLPGAATRSSAGSARPAS